jgi:hypothetical protein
MFPQKNNSNLDNEQREQVTKKLEDVMFHTSSLVFSEYLKHIARTRSTGNAQKLLIDSIDNLPVSDKGRYFVYPYGQHPIYLKLGIDIVPKDYECYIKVSDTHRELLQKQFKYLETQLIKYCGDFVERNQSLVNRIMDVTGVDIRQLSISRNYTFYFDESDNFRMGVTACYVDDKLNVCEPEVVDRYVK